MIDDEPVLIHFLSGSLKSTAEETRFLELALPGYDLSKLRDENDTPAQAEIIKIGAGSIFGCMTLTGGVAIISSNISAGR